MPITQDIVIAAKKLTLYAVTISRDGKLETRTYKSSESINFDEFNKEGYSFKVLNEKGDIISSLKVERDCAISVIYFKK